MKRDCDSFTEETQAIRARLLSISNVTDLPFEKPNKSRRKLIQNANRLIKFQNKGSCDQNNEADQSQVNSSKKTLIDHRKEDLEEDDQFKRKNIKSRITGNSKPLYIQLINIGGLDSKRLMSSDSKIIKTYKRRKLGRNKLKSHLRCCIKIIQNSLNNNTNKEHCISAGEPNANKSESRNQSRKERHKTEKEFNNSTNLDSRSQNVSLSDSHEFKLNGSMRNAFFKSNIRKEKMNNTSKNFNINAIKEAGRNQTSLSAQNTKLLIPTIRDNANNTILTSKKSPILKQTTKRKHIFINHDLYNKHSLSPDDIQGRFKSLADSIYEYTMREKNSDKVINTTI